MHRTRNDLSRAVRTKVIDLLDARLADAIDLQTQLKQAHWNVKGPTFIGLHELFDKITEAVEDYVDDLAERVVQLGGVAHGTARQVAKRSTLPEFPAVTAGHDHVEAVAAVLAAFGKLVRAAEGFLQRHREHAQRGCRFDVVSASGDPEAPRLEWIRDAFRADDC